MRDLEKEILEKTEASELSARQRQFKARAGLLDTVKGIMALSIISAALPGIGGILMVMNNQVGPGMVALLSAVMAAIAVGYLWYSVSYVLSLVMQTSNRLEIVEQKIDKLARLANDP